ncbi:lysophospholipid acyltransferase family protein [Brachybacterium sp. J144]|uniref:lysophospholipid acyltransferase family protein n=1 Tax=unclassified Brachybacterium TaxID=2623841 RepID=UPI002E780C47|nr:MULTISPECIES: lysophospholipid acyltransferase family protein [unclassified Brachybacterium]MEE1618089.1 lysophospholipid acyltransferase family protein [Brachybacterium sp. J153]MEE1651806.1 lysophospholipid acyltransferase family protein [Brachybacterium sp. J144]
MSNAFYFGARGLVRPFVRLVWNPRVTGLENVPRTGGFLIASNHLANVDSFLVPVVMPRKVRFVAKESLWTQKGPLGAILRFFFTQVEAVPVDREALASGKGAMQAALSILQDGNGFGIYPEGTRSKDGLLHPGKQGAAWLALESGCPVIPVGVKGTQELFGPGRARRGSVSIRVGAPIDFSDLDPAASKGLRRRLMTARIMDEIQALSGQRRSDEPSPDSPTGI